METKANKSLLLVEDEVLIAMATQQDLESRGYNVTHVTNGNEAVDAVFNDPSEFDLILMDINLGSGIEGTEAAKIILKKYDIPIVFLSSHTDPEIVKKTQNITSYGYVVKNSGITVLDASIQMAFRLNRERLYNLKTKKNLILQTELSQLYLDLSEEIFLGLDNNGNISLANKKAAKVLECNHDEIVGKNWFDSFIPKDINEEMKIVFKQIINGDIEPVEFFENEVVTRSGKIKTIRWHNSQYVKNNKVEGTISSGIDITAENKREEAIKMTEDKFKISFETSKQGIVIASGKGQFISVNDAACKMLKYDHHEFLKLGFRDLTHPDDIVLSIKAMENFLKDMKPYRANRRYITKTGDIIHCNINVNPVFDTENELLYCVIHIIDKTEITKLKESFWNTEAKYEAIIKTTPFGIQVSDLEGKIIVSNPAHHKIHGYEYNTIEGMYIWDFVYDKKEKEQAKIYYEAIISQKPEPNVYYSTDKTKDGRIIETEIHWDYLYDKNNKLTGIVSIISDITKRKNDEKEIGSLLKEKEVLLREVHHRIKNNFTSIESLLLMQIQHSHNSYEKKYLEDTAGRINGMKMLYEHMTKSSEYQNINSKEYFKKLIESIELLYSGSKKIKLSTEIDDCQLSSDKLFLLAIIINELISNSIKYAFENTKNPEIRAVIKKSDKLISVEILDNGNGLENNFVINKSNGFGLSLVNMICKTLEGKFTIENSDDKVYCGTKCFVEFNFTD